MSLCLIYLPESFPLVRGEDEIPQIVRQANGKEDIQIIIFDHNMLEKTSIVNNMNVRIVSKENIKIDDIDSDYIMFLDKETTFSSDFFEKVLSEINSEEKYDFFQLTGENRNNNIQKHTDVIQADFDDIASLKIIRRDLLNTFDFFSLKNVNQLMLMELYFDLFERRLSFKSITNVKFSKSHNQSIETIINDGQILNHLVFSKDAIERKRFRVLFKKALFCKLLNLIDSRNFVDLLPYNNQEFILEVLRELLLEVDDESLKAWNLNGYLPFTQMVREGLYTEALYYIRLLRGKRYWFNTTKEVESKIKQYPIEESLSWKLTAPLRKSTLWRQKIKNYFVKWGLKTLSFPVKLRFIGQEVWLISERADQAEDNGYAFFKYCRENYPNKKIYYIINEDSPHVGKIKELGNIVYHSSLKHWLYMLVANKYISAWVFEETTYPGDKTKYQNIFGELIEKKPQITLQHGVIIHNIAPYLNKELYNQKLFIASSNSEKEVIKTTLGYKEEDIAVTGLSRFDNLHDLKVKKQILIMPTWRRSLFRLNQSEFLRSEYFNRYYHLIRNEHFLKLIEKENVEVKFYVHNQMQQFMNNFVFNHPNIQFLTKKDAIVSELLKESSLLITDYSSVMADFLYMEKPILLYQFDPYDNHHGPVKEISYADFGEVLTEEESLVEKISEIVNQDFNINEYYLKKSDSFFAYKDNKNSERIYQAIKKLNN
ncbi:hypothetical protein ASG99_06490 [Bacillus sp. Soil768D1]|nr:hypothetical protein ASG99_06490 [Bacillus sp. Soil768D1]